jgi:hypothetical protein
MNAYNQFALNYIRYKSNLILTSIALELYYLNLNLSVDSYPYCFGEKYTIIHLERTYYTIVNIICNFHKQSRGTWLKTDYYLSDNKWRGCFTYNIWLKLKDNSLTPFNLYEECDNWDDLFTMIERNSIQFKMMIMSLKYFYEFCLWIEKQNIELDNESIQMIGYLSKRIHTLEFKSLEIISTEINDEKTNNFFDELKIQ